MKAYADFDLSIERGGDSYLARVLRSPAGELPSIQFSPPFSKGELQELDPSSAGARRDVKSRRARSSQAAFKEAGAKLFRAVFAGEVLACWSASMATSRGRILRLRLRLSDPEPAGWPWEYLFDPRLGRWLALSPEVSIVRYPDLPEALEPLLVESSLRILVLVAARTGRRPLAADREWRHIENGLSGLRESGQVVLERLESVSLQALREKLRRETWHVLHFIGHGGLDSDGEGALLFEAENGGREEVSGSDLGALLLGHPELRLVVLNACEGAREGRGNAFSSVAQALVRSRIPAVVAMQVAVSDRAATSFARHFYRELAEGDPLDEVLTQTRRGMFSEHHKVEWGTPVLFLRDESGQIFVRPGKGTTGWKGIILRAILILTLAATLAFGIGNLLRRNAPAITEAEDKGASPSPQTPRRRPDVVGDPRCPSPPGFEGDLVFRFIEPGSFTMKIHQKNVVTPTREVIIGKPFCMAVYEVTHGQWAAIMRRGRSQNPGDPDDELPAVKISWDQAQSFIRRLNELDPQGEYRLPLDVEWEYAARAGTVTDYSFGDDPDSLSTYGNCMGRGGGDGYDETSPVGSFDPNDWELYDMHGNVWEWVQDTGSEPKMRVKRGGGWRSSSVGCGSSARMESTRTSNRQDTGFRIVRDPLPAPPK